MGLRRLATMFHGCLLSAGLLLAGPALAQSDGASGITIDLNKLESREAACRAYLVLENGTGQDFTAFTLDLYVFGPDGVISKRLAVNTVPLTPGKIRVRPVDIKETPCDQVSRILLNDVLDCADASGQRNDCVNDVTLSTHSDAEFVK